MRGVLFAAMGLVSVAACDAFDGAGNANPAPSTIDGGSGTDGGSSGALGREGGTDATAAQDFPSAVSALAGLAGYWRLSDGAKPPAKDIAGASDGDYQGTVVSAAGLLPGSGPADAISLEGAGDVKIAVTEKLKTFDVAATIGVLVRVKATSLSEALVEKDGVFLFFRNFTGVATLQLETGAGQVTFDSLAPVPLEQPDLLIAAYDLKRGEAAIWVNREKKPFTGLSASPPGVSSPICIGGAAQGGQACTVLPFSGVVDEVFLLNRMIDQEEVNLLMARAGL
jgi:hypothetical protein